MVPGWLRTMITRPDSETRETRDDPLARAPLDAYIVPLQVAGGMDETAARAVIDFLRRADGA